MLIIDKNVRSQAKASQCNEEQFLPLYSEFLTGEVVKKTIFFMRYSD